MQFLGRPEIDITPLVAGIRDRGNIGRWRRSNNSEAMKLSSEAMTDLARFGYDI
jgi:hypothetical protein